MENTYVGVGWIKYKQQAFNFKKIACASKTSEEI